MTLIRLQYGTHIREADIDPGQPILSFMLAMAAAFGPSIASAAFIMDEQAWARVCREGRPRNLRLEDAQGQPCFMGVRVVFHIPLKPTRRPLNSPCAPA